MAIDCVDGTPLSMEEEEPVSNLEIHQSELIAHAGRDVRTCLAIPNSQARTSTGEIHFPCSAGYKRDR